MRASPAPALNDRDGAALAARLELDRAVLVREDRVVASEAGARAWAEPRPALAHEDHARLHRLSGEDLDAEHLRIRVAAVPRGAESFLVCHLALLLRGRLTGGGLFGGRRLLRRGGRLRLLLRRLRL